MGKTTTELQIDQTLLQAAVRLFAHKGFVATSTREIVEAAGVTKPMLYYYFESKEGLLRSVMSRFLDQFHDRLRHVLGEDGEPRQLLVEVVWTHFEYCQANKDFARLFYALYFGPDSEAAMIDLNQYAQVGHELVVRAVKRACESGLAVADKEPAFTMAIHGMINIWIIAALKEDRELSRPLAEQLVDELLSGFGR